MKKTIEEITFGILAKENLNFGTYFNEKVRLYFNNEPVADIIFKEFCNAEDIDYEIKIKTDNEIVREMIEMKFCDNDRISAEAFLDWKCIGYSYLRIGDAINLIFNVNLIDANTY